MRRAQTTVELGSGQSFAIAGLFQNNVTSELQSLPWLGDLPVLGALFRSDRFLRNESELVIIVTPYLTRPTSQTTSLHVPTDGLMFASDLDRLLFGKVTANQGGRPESSILPAHRLRGAAGFISE